MQTDEELKKLATDIVDGKVFGTWNIPNKNDIPLVFLVLFFAASADNIPKDALQVYEYLDKAGPCSINGYPQFTSCKFLDKQECVKLEMLMAEYREIKKKFMETQVQP